MSRRCTQTAERRQAGRGRQADVQTDGKTVRKAGVKEAAPDAGHDAALHSKCLAELSSALAASEQVACLPEGQQVVLIVQGHRLCSKGRSRGRQA